MNRIQKVQNTLRVDALLIENPIDLFYLTGLSVSTGRLLIQQQEAILFVDGRYVEQAKKEAPCKVRLLEKWKEHLPRQVAFDSAFVSYDAAIALQKQTPEVEWIPLPKPLKKIRGIKEKGEIASLKKAAKVTWGGYQYLLSLLQEGIQEEELALEFEIYCRRHGASRLSFPPIVAFGENSAYPHYRAAKARLRPNQIILFDLGAVVDGYAGDMTRVHFFGSPDPQLEADYALLKRVQQEAISRIRPGIFYRELDQFVRQELEKTGVASLFTHSLSHGVGLEIHEYPSLKKESGDLDMVLEEGLVFTVEPGLYRSGLGGVRYEDTVVVTKDGVENFYAQ